jgi:glucokinase
MLKRFDHVSVEHVCSGIGIPNVYEFLRDVEHIPEKPEVAKAVASAKDPSVVIIESGMEPHIASKLCRTAIDMFVSILASEAGNLAVKVFATGGIYLAGGVIVHTLAVLLDLGFMESFKRKGRFVDLMERIPIHVVTARAALVGAATYGLNTAA